MKMKFVALLIALFGLTTLQSCEDEKGITVSQHYKEALAKLYPAIQTAKWEKEAGYTVAEFTLKGVEMEVWFDHDVLWRMTVSDYQDVYSILPDPITDALRAGQYVSWTIDDIKEYERPDITFWTVEVETRGSADRLLFFLPDGTLLKDVPEKGTKVLPTTDFPM